jgi:RNA polymerase sigma-70 factor, ECF subfamily
MDAWAAAIDAAWQVGRTRWAALPPLPREPFAAHVELHAPPGEEGVAYVQAMRAEDFYLACACLERLDGAAQALEDGYLSRVPAFVAQVDAARAFADEVGQRLRERLLVAQEGARPRIADYSGRGTLVSWLRVAAVRIAIDLKRDPHEARRVDSPSVIDELAEDSEPELQLLRTRHAAALADALRRAIGSITPEHRVILRMYFSQGLSTGHIASALRVDRSTAARRLTAAREAVYVETRRLLREALPLATDEFSSVARALHSQLDVSLTGLLNE